MAVKDFFDNLKGGARWDVGVSINRSNSLPLDANSVFSSFEAAQKYAAGTPEEGTLANAYPGQVLAVVTDNSTVIYYIDANKQLQPVGNANEVMDYIGELPEGSDVSTIVDYINAKTEGIATDAALGALQATVTELDTVVNGKEANGEEEAVEGLVTKVADNTAAITAEATARGIAISELATAVENAEKAAKEYTDSELAKLDTEVDAVAARATTLETVVGDAENGLVKGLADEIARATAVENTLDAAIKAIDYVKPAELDNAIKDFVTKSYVDTEIDAIEEAISNLNHFKAEVVEKVEDVKEVGVLYLIKDTDAAGDDKYNEYIVVDGKATLIGDTTTDLSNYYNKTEIDGKFSSVNAATNAAIDEETAAREALATRVKVLEDVDNATQAELDAYKEQVTAAINTAKADAIADADGKLANKANTADVVANTTFASYQESVVAAISAARSGAVSDVEAKCYATEADVNAKLAKKVETATIAHTTTDQAEGVTVSGTVLNIVVDSYKKNETYSKSEADEAIEAKITQMNGGESAGAVLAALNNYKKATDTELYGADTVASWTGADGKYTPAYAQSSRIDGLESAVANAQARADQGVADAAKVAVDLAAALVTVGNNTTEINSVKAQLTSANEAIASKIAGLEANDTKFSGDIAALQTAVTGHTTTLTGIDGAIQLLQQADTQLDQKIQANTNKFADYYTKKDADEVILATVTANKPDLTPYAKTTTVEGWLADKANNADVYTIAAADAKFMTESQVDARVNTLIDGANSEDTITNVTNLVAYVNQNAADVADLITKTNANNDKLADITGTVGATITSAVTNAIASVVQPKASEEITVANDGTLGIGEVSTDKLVQGKLTLVLHGGTANEAEEGSAE